MEEVDSNDDDLPTKYFLIIEDSPISQLVAQHAFKTEYAHVADCKFDCAESFGDAISILKKREGDGIVYAEISCDYTIKGLKTGADAIVEIRSFGDYYATVPIRCVTSEIEKMKEALARSLDGVQNIIFQPKGEPSRKRSAPMPEVKKPLDAEDDLAVRRNTFPGVSSRK